ncbi:hypothetical protein ScPMuIL_007043 [Solemya velum]
MGDTTYSVGDELMVFVTHLQLAGNECFFYAQLGSDADEINQVTEDIGTFTSDGGQTVSDVSTLNKGDLCIALFNEDGLWYRAKILKRVDNVFQVFFIDYGNIENVDAQKIQLGNANILSVRGLATECKLANVFPSDGKSWSSAEKEQIEDYLYNEEFTGKLVSKIKSTVCELQLKKNGEPVEKTLKISSTTIKDEGVSSGSSNNRPLPQLMHLQPGNDYISYISHLDSSQKFWIQIQTHENDLADLMAKLSEKFEGVEMKSAMSANIGTYCVTRFSEDESFYRAMVTAIDSDHNYSVQFVDYGNSEKKTLAELFPLPDNFCSLPQQAVKCTYEETNTSSNLSDSLLALSSEAVTVRVKSSSSTIHVVSVKEIEKDTQDNKPNKVVENTYSPLVLKMGSVYDVGISNLENPGSFSVQIIDNAPVLEKLMMAIDQSFDHLQNFPSAVTVGIACLARFSDRVVYRGHVVRVRSDGYDVLGVDFGHSELLPSQNLKPIPTEYKSLPSQCVHCSLDLQRYSWSASDNKLVQSLIGQPLVAKFKPGSGGLYEIDLYDTNRSDRHINSEVSVTKTDLPVQEAKYQPNMVNSGRSAQPNPVQMPKSIVPSPEVVVHTTELICVTAINSSASFFGQLMKTQVDKVAKLQEDLNSLYETQKVPDLKSAGCLLEIGTFCCSSYDSGWYRAMITAVPGNQVEVCYIDFGDKKLKSPKDLKYLKPEFCKLPQQCIICEFPSGMVKLSKHDLEKSLVNQPVEVSLSSKIDSVFPHYLIELTSRPSNRSIKAALHLSERKSGDSFMSEKRNEGSWSDRKRQNSGPSQPPQHGFKTSHVRQPHRSADEYRIQFLDLNCEEDVLITHVIDPDSFHCQINKNSTELDKLMDELHTHYSALDGEQERLENPTLMKACIAQYSVDQGWYRAKVTGLLSTGLAEVMFTDYGNCECMPRENLKSIAPEYLALPAQAVLCSLHGVAASQGFWPPEHIAQFEDLFLDQTCKATFHKYIREQGIYTVTLKNSECQNLNDKFGSSTNSICTEETIGGVDRSVTCEQDMDLKIKVKSSDSFTHRGRGDPSDTDRSFRSEGKPGGAYGRRDFGGRDIREDKSDSFAKRDFGGGGGNKKGFGQKTDDDWDSGTFRSDHTHGGGESSGFGTGRSGFSGDRRGGRFNDGERGGRFGDRGGGRFDREGGSGFNKDRDGGGFSRDRDRSFGGDRGGGSFNRDREGGGFNRDRGGGFGGDKGGRGFGGGRNEESDWGGSGFKKERRDGGGFGGDKRGGGFGSEKKNNADDDWGDELSDVKTETTVQTVPKEQTNTASKSRFRGIASNSSTVTKHDTSNLTQLKMNVGETYDVFVIYTITPANFVCQLHTNSDDIQDLLDQMNEHYNASSGDDLQPSRISEHMVYAVKFPEDSMWYRAEVTDLHPTTVEVLFVDYGNSCTVTLGEVKELSEQFLKHPKQGLKCALSGLEPVQSQWSDEASEQFENMTVEKQLKAQVVKNEGDVWYVRLQDTNSDDISAKLTEMGYCHEVTCEKTTGATEYVQSAYPLLPVDVSQSCVFISWIENPSIFYCQLEDNQMKLDEITAKLQEDYETGAGAGLVLDKATVGMAVIAKFSEDESWYRAEVRSVSNNNITVFFVDFGNSDVVSLESIRKPLQSYYSLPAQAVMCCLKGLKPVRDNWTADAKDSMYNLVENGADCNFLHCKHQMHEVHIKVGELDVSEALVKAGVAKVSSDSPPESPLPKGVPSKSTDVSVPKSCLKYTHLSYPPNHREKIYVSYIDSIENFSCQPVGSSTELEILMSKLENHTAAPPLDEIIVGMPCMAKYSVDGQWYRAVVMSLEGNTVHVHFVDYGNSESVEKGDISTITEDLMTLPAQAIHCCLNMGRASSQEGIMEKFEEAVMDKELDLVVQTILSDDKFVVDLEEGGSSVISSLVESETESNPVNQMKEKPELNVVNPESERYPDILWPIGSSAESYISHSIQAGTKGQFYIQLASLEDQLHELMSAVEESYGTLTASDLVLENLVRDQPCCAKYSLDGSWYRGVIEDSTADTITVHFIDYGNSESIVRGDVKQLLRNFLDIQPMAFECTLSLAPTDFEWNEAAVAQFDQLTFDKKLLCHFISVGSVDLEEDGKDVFSSLVVKSDNGEDLSAVIESRNKDGLGDGDSNLVSSEYATSILPTHSPPTNPDNACVSYVEDNLFYLQLCGDKNSIDDMPNKLLKLDSNKRQISPGTLEAGLACMVVDDGSHRGVILNVVDQECEVRFIDSGEIRIVSCETIYHLPADLGASPPMALQCKMRDVTGWSQLQWENFSNYTINKVLNVRFFTFDVEPYSVVLSEANREDVIRIVDELPCDIPTEVLNFPDLGLAASDKAKVVVSCSASPDSFWCQLSNNLEKIDHLMNFITEHYANRQERISATELQLKMPCIAKFSEDENWYRGRIVKIAKGCCDVLFIDYGNTEEVPLIDLQAIKLRHLQRWPAQAFHCRLDVGTNQIEWNEEAIELFSELTLVENLHMEIVEKLSDGVLKINLEDGGTSLCKKLLENSKENYFEGDSSENGAELVKTNELKLKIDASEILNNIEDLMPLMIIEEQRVQVTVSYSDSPSSFWVQPTKNKKDLDTLLDQMFEYYSELGETELPIDNPQVGGLCAAKYVDDFWYRARITGIMESQEYEVFFLDHGNKEVLTGSSLKCLVGYFGSLPIQAVECAMAGLRSPEGAWNEEAKEAFKELTSEKCLLADIITVGGEDSCIVQLMDMGISVGKTLMERGLGADSATPVALSKRVRRVFSDASDIITPLRTSVHTPTKLCYGITKFLKPELTESEKYNVVVSHSTSPNDFWCQLTTSTKTLQNIAESLRDSYDDSESMPVSEIEPGRECVVLCSNDNLYYRSGITSVNGDEVHVVFVDYGKSAAIKSSEVKVMKLEHLEICHQAFPCALANIEPNTSSGDWSEEACNRFKQLVDEKCLVAEIVELHPGAILHVLLYDNEDSISKCLISEGFATVGMNNSLREITEIGKLNITNDTVISENTSESDSESEFHSTEETEGDLQDTSHEENVKTEDPISDKDESEVYENSTKKLETGKKDESIGENSPKSRLESSQESDIESQSGDELQISAIDTGLDNSISCPFVFRKLNVDDEYIVTISEVVNPDIFFVRVLADESEQEDLYREITAYVKNNADEKMDHYQLGEACLAFCDQTSVWCRARIDGVHRENIDVFLVDFGSMKSVPLDCVRPLPVQFLMYPTHSVMCGLSEIVPKEGDNWTKEAIDFFKGCCYSSDNYGVMVEKEMDVNHYSVCLAPFDVTNDSLNRMMASADFATAIPGSSLDKILTDDLDLESSFLEVSIQRENSFGDSGSEPDRTDAADDTYNTLDVTGFSEMCSFSDPQTVRNLAIIDPKEGTDVSHLDDGKVSEGSPDDLTKGVDLPVEPDPVQFSDHSSLESQNTKLTDNNVVNEYEMKKEHLGQVESPVDPSTNTKDEPVPEKDTSSNSPEMSEEDEESEVKTDAEAKAITAVEDLSEPAADGSDTKGTDETALVMEEKILTDSAAMENNNSPSTCTDDHEPVLVAGEIIDDAISNEELCGENVDSNPVGTEIELDQETLENPCDKVDLHSSAVKGDTITGGLTEFSSDQAQPTEEVAIKPHDLDGENEETHPVDEEVLLKSHDSARDDEDCPPCDSVNETSLGQSLDLSGVPGILESTPEFCQEVEVTTEISEKKPGGENVEGSAAVEAGDTIMTDTSCQVTEVVEQEDGLMQDMDEEGSQTGDTEQEEDQPDKTDEIGSEIGEHFDKEYLLEHDNVEREGSEQDISEVEEREVRPEDVESITDVIRKIVESDDGDGELSPSYFTASETTLKSEEGELDRLNAHREELDLQDDCDNGEYKETVQSEEEELDNHLVSNKTVVTEIVEEILSLATDNVEKIDECDDKNSAMEDSKLEVEN